MVISAPTRRNSRAYPRPVHILTGLGFVIAVITIALTWGSEEMWIGHALTGAFGFLLLLVTLISAAAMKGRPRVFGAGQAAGLHHTAGIAFAAFAAGTFVLGLLTRALMDDPLLGTGHGILGLAVLLLASIQLLPSRILGRSRLFRLHRIAGYSLLLLFILQMILGFALSDLFAG